MTYVLSASAKANKMDTEMVESIDVTDDARSFSWAVDSAIRSETGSIFGESRVRSFASLVDSAIRSSSATEADLESSPVQAEDRAMRSSSSGTDLGTSPFHVFATAAGMRTVAATQSYRELFNLLELILIILLLINEFVKQAYGLLLRMN